MSLIEYGKRTVTVIAVTCPCSVIGSFPAVSRQFWCRQYYVESN